MRKAPIKIQKGLICCYIDDKSQAILIVPQTDYINVYRKNKIAFYKKNANLFPFTAENQYICTPINEKGIKYYK